jgi:uncharacterized protein YxeA
MKQEENNDDVTMTEGQEGDITLSLQSYEEQRIHHFEENGEEKYVKYVFTHTHMQSN